MLRGQSPINVQSAAVILRNARSDEERRSREPTGWGEKEGEEGCTTLTHCIDALNSVTHAVISGRVRKKTPRFVLFY